MVEVTHEIGRHEKFATLTVCSMDRWVLDTTFRYHHKCWEAAVGETLVCVREPRNAHDTCDRYAAAGGNYSWWQSFCGFNFCGVEGTHENFSTTKISAYTVHVETMQTYYFLPPYSLDVCYLYSS